MSYFIVLDGPDGSGTTYHCAALSSFLRKQGHHILETAEPTNTSTGLHIREILNSKKDLPPPDALQLLFCADRAEHVANVIRPALLEGKTVVCDRYTYSTIVYGTAQGVDTEWLTTVNNIFPKPDLTILTLPPFHVCLERLGRRNERDQLESGTLQKHIYDQYHAIHDPHVATVDTSLPRDEVAQHIANITQELLNIH